MIKFLSIVIVLLFSGCIENKNSTSWHEDAIWYQIFPDRFYNGDTSNDPTIESLTGTWPYEIQESWEVMPWTDQWYKFQPWETKNGKDFYYNAQLRRYGGDLQGIIDKLDYLQDLGVNAIYINPIFESPSAHKYGVQYYHHVDNNFGPDPDGDVKIWDKEDPSDPQTWQWTSADLLFLELIEEVHRRNMYIIIDGVFNHVGIPFWAFEDVKNNGVESPYASWFSIKKWDDPTTEINEFEYEGWVGYQDLPELSEDEQGLIPSIQSHIHAIVKRWMDPNNDGDPSDGIDGWRLDVAETVNINFWRTFRKWVKDINPHAYLTGEVWWENFWDNIMIDASPWIQKDVFHSVMNYRFADAVFKFFIDNQNKISAEDFSLMMNQIIDSYGYENILKIQNLYGSHDTERIASACVNPNRWIDHANNLNYNPEFKIRKPNSEETELLLQLIAFQFMFPGTPYIYYGDEVGMWGADDPDCRKPMVWDEFKYENENIDPFGNKYHDNEVSVNYKIYKQYKSMIYLRKNYPQLRYGSFEINYSTNGIFAFTRRFKNKEIFSIFNTNESPITIPWDDMGVEKHGITCLIGDNDLLPRHGYGIYEVN